MERRELERERERERERLLHQQRIAESNKQAAAAAFANAARDRSPLRNGIENEVRVKEEPRLKEEEVLVGRTDHRYHSYLNRHPSITHSVLDRSRTMLGAPPLGGAPLGAPLGAPSLQHYPPPGSAHWPDPYAYRYDPLRYNPLMEAAMRAEDERLKLFYGHPNPHLRKDPAQTGLLHMRPGTGPGPPPGTHKLIDPNNATDILNKKDESQSR